MPQLRLRGEHPGRSQCLHLLPAGGCSGLAHPGTFPARWPERRLMGS